MSERAKTEVAKLFINGSERDNEAFRMVRGSSIRCQFLGPTPGLSTPCLVYKRQKYFGTKEIGKILLEIRDK